MMRKQAFRTSVAALWGATALLIVVVALQWNVLRVFAMNQYENVAYLLDPSTARAFAYGERHFDASDPANYDIRRADYFFELVAAKDPTIPYLYHELARIAFLQGDFNTALGEINFQISMHGDSEPHAYYVRGLIEGYMGQYDASAGDYAHFLQFEPDNWAAKNDEAWVLLKAQHYEKALQVTDSGLGDYPSNAWLLNSKATALFELGDYKEALATAQLASTAVSYLTPQDWSVAYPGNDPAIAPEGLATFKASVAENIHTIQAAIASSTLQSK